MIRDPEPAYLCRIEGMDRCLNQSGGAPGLGRRISALFEESYRLIAPKRPVRQLSTVCPRDVRQRFAAGSAPCR